MEYYNIVEVLNCNVWTFDTTVFNLHRNIHTKDHRGGP